MWPRFPKSIRTLNLRIFDKTVFREAIGDRIITLGYNSIRKIYIFLNSSSAAFNYIINAALVLYLHLEHSQLYIIPLPQRSSSVQDDVRQRWRLQWTIVPRRKQNITMQLLFSMHKLNFNKKTYIFIF